MREHYLILAVEDDETLLKLYSEFLSRRNCRVDCASSGAQALSLLHGHIYDLVLIDIKLPDMNGIEILKWVRENSPDSVAIIFSGHATIEVTLEAISLGAFDFLVKPIELARLGIVVENGLERRKMALENKRLIADLQIAKRNLEARMSQRAEQLKKSEQKFRALYDNAPDVYYTVDTRGRIIDCNKMASTFFGSPKRELKAKHLLDLYTSDNFELVTCMIPTPDGQGGRVRHQEVKVKRADGSVAHVEINSNLVYDNDGKVIGALTIQRDITARKKTEDLLRESEERYRTIFQTAEVALAELDYSELKSALKKIKDQGIRKRQDYLDKNPEFVKRAISLIRAVDVNKAAIKLFGARRRKDLLGPVDKFITPESSLTFKDLVLTVARGGKAFQNEGSLFNLHGEKIYTLVSLAIPPREAKFTNLLVSLVDITERIRVEEEKDLLLSKLHELNRQLETLAITDGLTRLYNHRFFMETLNREFSRAQRMGLPLSLLMTDIDHFKDFNDTYGHQLGDEVLLNVADVLKKYRRGSDIVARYGGEEFVLLLPDTSMDKALVVAEKLRQRVEQASVSSSQGNLRITMSLGVHAMEDGNLDNPKDLLIMADKALYLAKKSGRNRVCTIHADVKV